MTTVTAAAAQNSSGARKLEDAANNTPSALDKDAFLKILVAQLANQDPLSPQDDTAFISQLAQFSSLEQMQSLNTAFSTSQAYSLLGKYVYVTEEDASGATQTTLGKVDTVVRNNGVDYLMIGGQAYELSSVIGALDQSVTTGLEGDIAKGAKLVGKKVTATVTNDDGTKTSVTGTVSMISVHDEAVYATVNNKEYLLSNITEL